MTLVLNKEPNIKDWPLKGPKGAFRVVLHPGINDVPQEHIDILESQKNTDAKGNPTEPGNSTWRFYKRRGSIKIVDDLEKENGDPAESFEDLSELKSADAIKLVKATLRIDVIRRWSTIENRVGVGRAIQAQIEKLTPPGQAKFVAKDDANDANDDEDGDE